MGLVEITGLFERSPVNLLLMAISISVYSVQVLKDDEKKKKHWPKVNLPSS